MYKRQYAAPARNALDILSGFIGSKGEPQLKYLYDRANQGWRRTEEGDGQNLA